MKLRLGDLPMRCFQGVTPTVIATCDRNGIPNATYLSQVFFLDDDHVALSCQFFNKTKKNVLENPYASLEMYDPQTLELYRIEVRFDHAETTGPLFEKMSARIDAIASHTGMKGVFKLVSADVYDVLSVERIEGFIQDAPSENEIDEPPKYRSEIHGLQLVAQRTARATDLDGLLSTLLETLEEAFGFEHSMVLLCDEAGSRLYAVASRGYEGGIGAEVGVGEGFIGTVARERCILRVAGVGQELRYGRTIRATVHRASKGRPLPPEIPLPGLVDAQSQLALPLVAGGKLVGVIAVESRSPAAFEEWHEAYLEIIATQVAFAIESIVRRGREADAEAPRHEDRPSAVPSSSVEATARVRRFAFYANDDCVFVDDEYLVRNVPGKILWKLLRTYASTGRVDFTNRELRLDVSLGLPAVRDNLESRLVLLRKRLEQKCPDLAIVPTGRGQFRLVASCNIALEERDGAT
jgi:hypothetical protein